MIKTIPIPVSELMSRDLVVLKPEDNLKAMQQCFRAYNIHHIPVVDDAGKLLGLLTRSDFARSNYLLAHFKQGFKEILLKMG